MTLNIKPEWKQEKKKLRHTWAGLVNIDQFRWMTRKDTLDQLRTAREEIGARHVRAVGMFDDELKVVGPDPAKSMSPGRRDPRVNWQVVDYVIQSQGLKKPSYHAHELLCRLGTESVPSVMEGTDMTGAINRNTSPAFRRSFESTNQMDSAF